MVQRGERLAFAVPGGLAAALWCLGLGSAYAQSDELAQLRGLSIEQLSNLEVTSVSRRAESIAGAAAAIDVITNEDILRSGVQTLPEVLRLARNLQVARVDAQRYAISARGFNSFAAANKLLVLVDGRSIYTPLYSGVFWDQHHVMLDNVERIEVISGPGGALWGANAVNGVINVITRPAEETQGVLVNGFAGSLDQRLDLQYGGQAGELSYRIFASAFDRAASLLPGGAEADDAWRGGFVGFRTDWGDLQDSFMLQGQLFASDNGGQGDRDGGHLLGHWRRLLEDGSSVEVQTYYSQSGAETVGVTDALEVWDIEAQHAFSLGSAHQIVWGGGYRYSESAFATFANPSRLVQEERGLRTLSAFIQDEIALRQNLSLTLGLKAEDHTFTGLEYMPSVRVAWRPGGEHLVWAAVSRGARTPSRIDRELISPGVVEPGDFQSEYLLAYELGYRTRPTVNSTLSANLYLHEYEGVRTANFTPPGVLPVQIGNGLHGDVYGLEIWGDMDINETWRVSAGATLQEQDLQADPLTVDINGSGLDPEYQVFLRTRHDLTERLDFDLNVRAVGEASPQIPAYAALGARLAYQLNDRAEIALIGENLLDESHLESIDEGRLREARRGVHLSLRMTY